MYNITLICTIHEEKGAFNLDALYKILEIVNPEIIFEEIPPYAFDEFYKDKTRNNLETDVINKYLENHVTEHVPVDYDFTLPQSFFKEHEHIHRRVEARSHIYKNLIDAHSTLVKQYGLKFLNSTECININKQIDEEIEIVLQLINNEKLIKINNYWNEFMEKRENEMIKNIYSYAMEHQFERGLFIIGAAHRGSIIDKIMQYPETEKIKVNWNYSNYENIL
jgi:hypothetical protein